MPVMSVENFYEDPGAVREFALQQEFTPSEGGKWPGVRTQPIHNLNEELFNSFCRRLFGMLFDFATTKVEWNVGTAFQFVEPTDAPTGSPLNTGWIHVDDVALFAGVIYLDEDPDPKAGTSVYTPKQRVPSDVYKGWVKTKENYYQYGVDNGYEKTLSQHHDWFDESVRVNNAYNRMVIFDGGQFHAGHFSSTKPRLTQVFFVNSLDTDSPPPLVRLRHS